jgi:hypothetical protein
MTIINSNKINIPLYERISGQFYIQNLIMQKVGVTISALGATVSLALIDPASHTTFL